METIEDRAESAKDLPGPEAARRLQAGEASALVVTKLDRLSRSMMDFTGLMPEGTAARLGALVLIGAILLLACLLFAAR